VFTPPDSLCTGCALVESVSFDTGALEFYFMPMFDIQETTPSVINWQDYEGCTALHLAVADGNEAVVAALVNIRYC